MIGDNAKRIRKMERTIALMDDMVVAPTVNGEPIAEEAVIAIILGVRAGFVAAKVIAQGKCDDMDPLEIATRAYKSAFDLYIEGVVLGTLGDEDEDGKGADNGREQEQE